LTNGAVERFKCRPGKDQDVLWCGETKGFGVRVSSKSKTRTYILVYRVKGIGRERYITIGRHKDPFKVDQARARALELKTMMLGDGKGGPGKDPVEEAKRQRKEAEQRAAQEKAQATKLREVLEDYLANRNLRPSTAADYRRHCENNLTTWLDEPVKNITRDKCLAKFTEITARGAPIQANLCMIYLRALLNHARIMHEDEEGNPSILAANPVNLMLRLRKNKLNTETERKTRIPLDKVGACWLWLKRRAESAQTDNIRTGAHWLMFILLTGTRRTESASLKWADVDMEKRTITFRAEVTKTHRELELPMSDAMHELLTAQRQPVAVGKAIKRRQVQRSAEHVFPTNARTVPYITNAQSSLDGLTKVAGSHVHLHALRRTFESVGMHLGIDGDVRRMLLNHVGKDVHGRNYANDQAMMKGAIEKIAAHIVSESKVAEAMENGSNVVRIGTTG
jgi:integrase